MTRTDRAREFVQGGHGRRLAVEMASVLTDFAASEVDAESAKLASAIEVLRHYATDQCECGHGEIAHKEYCLAGDCMCNKFHNKARKWLEENEK